MIVINRSNKNKIDINMHKCSLNRWRCRRRPSWSNRLNGKLLLQTLMSERSWEWLGYLIFLRCQRRSLWTITTLASSISSMGLRKWQSSWRINIGMKMYKMIKLLRWMESTWNRCKKRINRCLKSKGCLMSNWWYRIGIFKIKLESWHRGWFRFNLCHNSLLF